MKTIAYLRISTASQDCDNQRLAILDYAHRHRMTIDEFVSIQVSSRKTPRQRGILELLKRLEPEDILLVSELSRLGRSVGQIIQMVDYLIRNRIRFVAIKESIELSAVPIQIRKTTFKNERKVGNNNIYIHCCSFLE